MNDDLQKALASILNKTVDAVETSVGFLQRQLPDVIQQLLVWHAVRSAIWFIVALILTIFLVFLTKRVWVWAVKEDVGAEPVAMFPAGGAIVTGLTALNNTDWLQIWIAPKLYLVEYAASLAK